jgi:cytochrome c-type biogenesis protein CcmE
MLSQRVRIGGRVVDGTIKWNPRDLRLEFQISDKETADVLTVKYKGVVPDTFKNGVEAVADGVLTPEGYFEADNLLAKCPSKYEPAKSKGKGEGKAKK